MLGLPCASICISLKTDRRKFPIMAGYKNKPATIKQAMRQKYIPLSSADKDGACIRRFFFFAILFPPVKIPFK